MSDFNIDSRKLDLLKRTNNLLEKTKKYASKYAKERKILLELTSKKEINYDELSNILDQFEKLMVD